jgi:Rrf2 family protein
VVNFFKITVASGLLPLKNCWNKATLPQVMLSKKCQYALHALQYMAEQPFGHQLTIEEIAVHKNISKKFLETILCNLKASGILASRKGKLGGYYINRPLKQVSILEVVRIIDGAVVMLPCVSLNFYESCGGCEDESVCSINAVFKQVRDETLKILSANTLEDLIGKPEVKQLIRQ